MSTSVASDLQTTSPQPLAVRVKKIAIVAAKFLVTGACFWYVARQIDLSDLLSAIPLLDFRWVAFATLIVMLQIPLLALRWRNILSGLGACNERMTRTAMIAMAAIGVFFVQVLPSVMGEGVRAWLLVRLGCGWRAAVTSVVLDRAVGVGVLIAFGFAILLLPAGAIALGDYRDPLLVAYAALLVAAMVGLLLAPKIVWLLERWRYSRWIATLTADAHRVLLGPKSAAILGLACLIHTLTILIVWSLGRAQGLALPLTDAAVLFTVMVGVSIAPISIGGWGLRELAVIALLGNYGVAPGTALMFSICFGLTVAIGSLPGALVWLLYPIAPLPRPAERDG
jgi:glycosyltransferase 2 family protein